MSEEKKPPADLDSPKLDAFILDENGVVDSVALKRLIEEVRLQNEPPSPNAYNRIYNRHNRS